jgi:two-component system sensor kinase FixL
MFDSLGTLYAICGISTDITEQKRLEETLRISRDALSDEVKKRTTELVQLNQFLLLANRQKERALGDLKAEKDFSQKLIDTAQDALVSIDRQARIMLFNPAAERMFGYTSDEVRGKKVNLLMAEPYATEHDGYIARYERTQEPHAIGRIRTVTAKRKNGKLFPVEISVTEIDTDDVVYYAAFIRDISEKTRLQEELIEKEKLATVGMTAAKIGHELANPLNSISLALQLLEQRVGKISTAQEAEKVIPNLAKIRDEVSRLNNLLSDFRAFARQETFRFRQTALNELIDDVIDLEAPRLAHDKVMLERDLPDDLPEVVIDRDKLKQVLLNLCRNAAEAMTNGGTITIKARALEQDVIVEISDTGSGISHDTDIFEPFFTTKKEGTGLGLTIVRQIIARHGGHISYRSEPGKGTTFRIALPRNGSGTSS